MKKRNVLHIKHGDMLQGQELDFSEFEMLEEDENVDIYHQLAKKEHYLMLAAEAGKMVLERNRSLENALESMNAEMTQRIEVKSLHIAFTVLFNI